jgi:hypothetical protein
MIYPGAGGQPGAIGFHRLKGLAMFFLIGIKTHPAVRVLVGAAMIAVGLTVGLDVTVALGAATVIWGGHTWFRRSRAASNGSDSASVSMPR